MKRRVHARHTDEDFEGMLAPTGLTGAGPAPDVVCCGDIHDAFVSTMRSRTLVNVGSVGNPLDEPQASYVILEGDPGDDREAAFGIQFVRVPYDIEAEIAVAASVPGTAEPPEEPAHE